MNRNKSSNAQLFLIEAAILIVVFSIASALIVAVFIKGHDLGIKADRLNEAVIYAQNVAEAIRSHQDVDQFASDHLIVEIKSREESHQLGHMTYYEIMVKDRYTLDLVYEIETGVYTDED